MTILNQTVSAFPITNPSSSIVEGIGLSKRELIAAMAMQGMLSNHNIFNTDTSYDTLVDESVLMADILLKQLGVK
jgi:D-alanyl-D-alanine carboxypeptidase